MEEIATWDLESIVIEQLDYPFLRKLQIHHHSSFYSKPAYETNIINLVKSTPALQSFSIAAWGAIVHEVFQQVADN